MSKLYNLDGRPQTWEELQRRFDAIHQQERAERALGAALYQRWLAHPRRTM